MVHDQNIGNKLVFPIVKLDVAAKSPLKYINKSCVTANDMVTHKQEKRYISDTRSLLYCFTSMILYAMEERERGAFLM